MVKTPHGSSPPSLGDLIDHVLSETGLTKAKLAGLIGINPSQLSRWTTGSVRPRYESVAELGEALRFRYPDLGIGPGELLAAAGYASDTPAHGPPPDMPTPGPRPRVSDAKAGEIADALHQLLGSVMNRMSAIEAELSELRTDLADIRRQLEHQQAKSA